MAYYLYIPFKKNEISEGFKTNIKDWIKLEREKNNEVIVTYAGKKGLSNLPSNAKIYVLMPGHAGKLPPLVKSDKIPSQIARISPSLSTHLTLSGGKHSKLIPQIADDMANDGLFNNLENTKLRIKLFFFNANKNAKTLADSFKDALDEHPNFKKSKIRIDYYEGNPRAPSKPKEHTTHKYLQNSKERSSGIRNSIYSSVKCLPKLSLEQVARAVDQYNQYKSSRCCGLSGLLGLNGLFSSGESTFTINSLKNHKISDERRFDLAKQFLVRYSENYFAQCLSPLMAEAKKAENLYWKAAPCSPGPLN